MKKSSDDKTQMTDALRLGLMALELGTAAATTIMLRNWHWVVTWPNSDRNSTAEGNRMVVEKLAAAVEVSAAWQRMFLGSWSGVLNPWRSGQKILAPLHRKATANARRLARRKPF